MSRSSPCSSTLVAPEGPLSRGTRIVVNSLSSVTVNTSVQRSQHASPTAANDPLAKRFRPSTDSASSAEVSLQELSGYGSMPSRTRGTQAFPRLATTSSPSRGISDIFIYKGQTSPKIERDTIDNPPATV